MQSLKNENKYIKALIHGDYDAFDTLYNHYADSIYGFVLKLTKSPSEAEDMVQETFMRVWDMRAKLNSDYSFKSYLFTIARNQIIDLFRNKVQSFDFETLSDISALVEDSMEQKINYDDLQLRIYNLKQKLTDKQRKIFELSREEGIKNDEIGQDLNLSEKTVRNQISLILNLFRKELLFVMFIAQI